MPQAKPRVVRLAILDSYGVRWSRETFARDLLQNFFDSGEDFRQIDLDVTKEASRVDIRGPVTFDLDLLAFIGATTKNDGRTVGGFGEGFKICALIGVRDFGLRMRAGSGQFDLDVFLDPVALGRELCYRVTRRAKPFPGSYVRLEECDAEILSAFEASRAMFRHPDNPKLRELLVEDPASGVAIFASPDRETGELYYRRQLRGTVRFGSGKAVTLACDSVVEELEGDRDRRDLDAYPLALAAGSKLSPAALEKTFLWLKPYWKYGHDVVSGLAQAAKERSLRLRWPKRWLARDSGDLGLLHLAERQGYEIAIWQFGDLGMPRPRDIYGTDLETRRPTPLERARFEAICDLYLALHGQRSKTEDLEVFNLAGAAVRGQHLGGKVIVAAELLRGMFEDAAPTALHELAHEAGEEESDAFLNRLRKLIGRVLSEPKKVAAARRAFAAARKPRPKREAEAKEKTIEAYEPRAGFKGMRDWRHCVLVTLVVPPGFPPSEEVIDRVQKASKKTGIAVNLYIEEVSGPVGAVRALAPGLPTLFVGVSDVERGAEERKLGYRVRTYGNGSLCPRGSDIVRALRRAAQGKRKRNDAFRDRDINIELGEKRVRELLGLSLSSPVKRPDPRAERNEALQSELADFAGYGGYRLGGLWSEGIRAAGEYLIKRCPGTERDVGRIWPKMKAALMRGIEAARALRGKDKTFDEGDVFERDAMDAAQGATVLTHIQAGALAARRVFRLVREATEESLDLPVDLEYKPALIEHALEAAGLSHSPSRRGARFRPAVFRREFRRGVRMALAFQKKVDAGERYPFRYDIQRALQDTPRKREIDARRNKKHERWSTERARGTLAVKGAYDRTLARGGTEVEAASRALAVARRFFPDLTGRRLGKGRR
ncbi:MAG: hypothetical protein HY720_21050 [Planctomycetes bacterium]|nr:hypothetical protein [Planctomycetota bacterium]